MNVNVLVTLQAITCCYSDCGIVFGVPVDWEESRRKDHSMFSCPNGHRQQYVGESEVERLQKQVASLQGNYDWMKESRDRARQETEMIERRRRAAQGQVTKLRKRAINGVCSFCNRYFANVAGHMQSQHKDEKAILQDATEA